MLDRFLDSRIWAEVQRATPVYAEYPLAHEVSNGSVPVVQRGVVDLAYRTEEGWVLVDHKSDRVRGASADAFAGAHPYAQQICTYAETWAAVLGEPVHRAGLWLADVGAHVVVVD